MEARKLTPMQIELLRMFSFDHSEEFANELKAFFNKYLQHKIDEETDKLWDAGILDAKEIENLKTEDLHLLRRNGSTGC